MRLSDQSSILWIDCIGGLLVGMIVLSLDTFISWLDSLPLAIVRFVGFANLAYGSYSLWLTTRAARKLSLIKILALANIAWLFVCIAIIVLHWDVISAFGVFHKLAEGLYVAALGVQEWRWRQNLAKERQTADNNAMKRSRRARPALHQYHLRRPGYRRRSPT